MEGGITLRIVSPSDDDWRLAVPSPKREMPSIPMAATTSPPRERFASSSEWMERILLLKSPTRNRSGVAR